MAETKRRVILLRHTINPQEIIAASAKLCYSPSNIEDLTEKVSEKDQSAFIDGLVESGHESPLEHVSFTFGIEGISRACTHQLVRHRIASYSQQSQRYVKEHSSKNIDGVFDYVIPPSVFEAGKKEWFEQRMKIIQRWYDELVEDLGNAGERSNEDARFLLPNAAETKIVVTMNVRELMHFFNKRCCNRAQWEIRDMAKEMYVQALKILPDVFKYAGPSCYSNNHCSEGKMSCGKADKVREEFRGYTK